MERDELGGLSREELLELVRRQQEELAEREAAIEQRDEKIRELKEELSQFRRLVKTPENSSVSPSLGCTFTAIGPPVEMALRAEVSHLVDTVATRDATMEAALRRAWANLQARVDDGDVPRRIRQLEMDGERARERLKRAALLFVDGMLDQAGYELAREQAEADVGATEAELGRLGALQQKPALPSIDLVLRDAPGWREILERNDLDAQRDLLAKVVEHIVPERVRVGHYRVRIAWTPTGELLRQLAVTAERVPAA